MNLKRFRTIWKKSQVRKDMKPKKSEVRKPRLAPLKQAGREKALARWSDGLFYIVNIVQISEAKKKCVVQFEDKSIASVQLKDVLKEKEGDDPCCHMCGVYEDSLASLVECNNCERAYHKKCHQPPIAASAVDDFVCRICVFASCAQPGGAKKTGALVEKFKEMKRTLPYDERYLVWDASHVSNVEHSYCYCGGPGHWYNKMLQCCRCRQWFHEACIHCMEEELLIGDRFYIFACSRCNEEEFLLRMDLSWLDVACVSLFHLSMTLGSRYVDLEERLLPFIKAKSHSFGLKRLLMDNCVGPGRQGLLLAIRQEMMKVLTRSSVFCCGQEVKKKNTWFGLRDRIPPTPPPHCVPLNDLVASHVYDKLYAGKTALFTPVKFNSPVPYVYKGAHKVTPPTLGARLKESKMAKLARLKSEHNYCSLSSDYDAEPPVLTPIDRLSPVPKMFEEFDRNNNSPVKCEKVSGDEDDGEEEEEEEEAERELEACGGDWKPRQLWSLELAIPEPGNFGGENHPFLTQVEQDRLRGQKEHFVQQLTRLAAACPTPHARSQPSPALDTSSPAARLAKGFRGELAGLLEQPLSSSSSSPEKSVPRASSSSLRDLSPDKSSAVTLSPVRNGTSPRHRRSACVSRPDLSSARPPPPACPVNGLKLSPLLKSPARNGFSSPPPVLDVGPPRPATGVSKEAQKKLRALSRCLKNLTPTCGFRFPVLEESHPGNMEATDSSSPSPSPSIPAAQAKYSNNCSTSLVSTGSASNNSKRRGQKRGSACLDEGWVSSRRAPHATDGQVNNASVENPRRSHRSRSSVKRFEAALDNTFDGLARAGHTPAATPQEANYDILSLRYKPTEGKVEYLVSWAQ